MVPYIHLGALSTTLGVFLGPTMLGSKKFRNKLTKTFAGMPFTPNQAKGGKSFHGQTSFFPTCIKPPSLLSHVKVSE